MKFLQFIKYAVHQADFFSTTHLIRYQQEPQFKTFTGGIFSLIIVILLSTIFGNMSLSAVRRENIIWYGQTAKEPVPPKLELNFSTFNIGVQLEGFNLSSNIQYFDVIMTLYTFKNKILQGRGTRIPLSMCKREDWAVNDDILSNFDRMNASNWLCPNPNSSFFIEGKWTSEDFSYLSLDVVGCGSANPNATCANKSDIDKALQNIMHFSVYYINSLVAPDQKEPIKYYLEDKDYVYFGKHFGGANYVFISDYKVTTDYSIFPYQDNYQATGGIVMLPTRISVQQVSNGCYASFIFRKATDKYVYTRKFTKFDTVVSYTGGLFGALIGVLFLMNHYTRTSFQVVLGSITYNSEDGQADEAKNMNLFRYFKYHFYKLLNFIGNPPSWKIYQNYDKCRVEIQKHLDIKFILDKLNFLERALHSVCGQSRFKALHLVNKLSLEDAAKYRQYYKLKDHIINSVSKGQKQARKTFVMKDQQKSERENESETPSSIFSQSKPFFSIGNGKIMPYEPKKAKQQLIDSKKIRQSIELDSVNVKKLTKRTSRQLSAMQSYLGSAKKVQDQSLSDQVASLVQELEEIKKAGENGDQLSQQIWLNLDQDVRMIIQKKINKFAPDIVLERQDIESRST